MRVRLRRPRNLAQPGARRGGRRSDSCTRSASGVETAPGLVQDSVDPPAGPPAPRLSLKDDAIGCAESRTRNALGAQVRRSEKHHRLRVTRYDGPRGCLPASHAVRWPSEAFAPGPVRTFRASEFVGFVVVVKDTRAATMRPEGGAGPALGAANGIVLQRKPRCRGAGGRGDRVKRESCCCRSTRAEQRARPV